MKYGQCWVFSGVTTTGKRQANPSSTGSVGCSLVSLRLVRDRRTREVRAVLGVLWVTTTGKRQANPSSTGSVGCSLVSLRLVRDRRTREVRAVLGVLWGHYDW